MDDPLKKLVKFMICLALLGTIIAVVVYFAVDLPAQMAAGMNAPKNYCIFGPFGMPVCT